MSINRVNISGNLTRDPELRMTAGGTQVLGFGVAVNDRRRNPQTGEWEDYPNFVDCTLFGNRAEAMGRILRKGIKVAIEGKLRYSKWQDKSGQNRSKLEVIVDEIDLMQQKQQGGYQQPQQAYAPQQYAQPAYQAQPAPQAYQQPQPAYRPQAAPQQAYQPQQAYAPQPQAYQQPQPAPQPQQVQQQLPMQQSAQAAPAQQVQQPAQQPEPELYDEDIPF